MHAECSFRTFSLVVHGIVTRLQRVESVAAKILPRYRTQMIFAWHPITLIQSQSISGLFLRIYKPRELLSDRNHLIKNLFFV